MNIEEDAIAFNIAPLWIQVWNLLVHWISKETRKKIGVVFNEAIPQSGGKEGRHIKILVMADISRPLMRGTIVKLNGTVKWINFKYEQYLEFYYKCGRVAHSEKSCKNVVAVGNGLPYNLFGP